MLSLKNDSWSSLPTVRFVFDGIVHGCSLCVSRSVRCSDPNKELVVQGLLSAWSDEMRADVDDLFNDTLGKTREGGCPGLRKVVGSLIAGQKRPGQKLPSTILCATARHVMIAPQQLLIHLIPSCLPCNSLMKSVEFEGEIRNLEEKYMR